MENTLPKKLHSRKDEITEEFFKLADAHLEELFAGTANKKFHAKDFAALLFIHPRHLTNTIKLTTGNSPCDYMEGRIQQEAERLLKTTDLSVAAIGYRMGYLDPTNFTKFFKSMAGITPLQYRKQMK